MIVSTSTLELGLHDQSRIAHRRGAGPKVPTPRRAKLAGNLHQLVPPSMFRRTGRERRQGKVAFQILIPFLDGDLAPLEDFHGSVVPIRPPANPILDWPPRYQFDATSIQALAVRINDNRENLTIEVNLDAAQRVKQAPPRKRIHQRVTADGMTCTQSRQQGDTPDDSFEDVRSVPTR